MDRTWRCPACDTPNFVTEVRLFRAQDEPLRCWKCEKFADHLALKMTEVRENRHQSLMGRPVDVMAAGILSARRLEHHLQGILRCLR